MSHCLRVFRNALKMVDRLTAERKTPDSRQSVKEALRDLQAEKKYGEDFPAPAEPIR